MISGVYCQSWDLKKDTDGVKVYTRAYKGSNIEEFKAEVTVHSNLSAVLTLIDKVSEYPKWMYKCTYAERLLKISESSGYTYSVLHESWPVTDRDVCSFYKVTQDPSTKTITVTITGAKDYIPEKDGRVRIPSINGCWLLIPLAKGVTKVVYQVHSESGGYVPATVVNLFITDMPYHSLLNLKKIVESPLYPQTVMEDVEEL